MSQVERVVLMSSASDHQPGSKNQKAQTFFQYGNDAAMKANFDYAIQMYQEACKLSPDTLLFRQALRGIERRKFDNDPHKVGRLVGTRTQPIKLRAKLARNGSQWSHVIEVCEEAFVHNPWDVGAAREAADAAEQLDFKELAQWFVESVQNVATDADFFWFAAHIHEINNAWPKAIAALERVMKINPNDQDVRKKINALAASSTIQRSGLGDSLQKREAAAKAEESRAKEASAGLDELKQPQLTPEERWIKDIQENATNVGPYLQYAEQLRSRGQLDEAEKLLSKGLKAVPEDPSLKILYAEVQVARIQRAQASWTRKCKDRPDDIEAKAKLDQLNTMLVDYEIEEYRRRIKLQPGEFNLHYELGLRLARTGNHKDAIAAFQQSRSSPTLKVAALHQAGLSFEAVGALKLAERNYQDALKAAEPEDLSILNALHYRLGRVYEAMGNSQGAEEHYNEVAANDYGYLDVAQRLRGLN